jgi:hypothetical protein
MSGGGAKELDARAWQLHLDQLPSFSLHELANLYFRKDDLILQERSSHIH